MSNLFIRIRNYPPGKKCIVYIIFSVLCVLLIALIVLSIYAGRVYYIKTMGIKLVPSQDLPVTITQYYRQNDPQWGEDTIGTSTQKMKSAGCLIASISTAIFNLNIDITPKELNHRLSQNNGFQGADLIWYRINQCFPEVNYRYSRIFNSRTIEKDLKMGLLPVVNVKYHKTGVTHWVLIVGAENGEFLICDPLDDGVSAKYLSEHGNAYAYRVIEKAQAGSDQSLEALTEIEYIREFDYNIVNPLKFLEILKRRPNGVYSPLSVPDDWIKYEHVIELIKHVDSEEPCAKVVSGFSSYLPQKQSTVGREAIFLIEGFLLGRYPPALHSEGFAGRGVQWYKTELEEFWRNQTNGTAMNNSTKSVAVDTVEAFFEAIGSNTIIYLEPGEYKLDELSETGRTNPYAYLHSEREGNSLDGCEIVIHDVDNLTIIGNGEKPVEILTKYQMVNVITFENAHNINLSNIRAGHWPDKGGCNGGVAVFKKSSDISMDRCSFFGCGINGLELYNVNHVVMTDSVIEDCNYHIMFISNSNNIFFKSSNFTNNRGIELINISGCGNVQFQACNITSNSGVTDTGVMFNIDGGPSAYVTPFERNNIISDILIRNSTIKDNTTVSTNISRSNVESAGSLVFEDTIFEENSFITADIN